MSKFIKVTGYDEILLSVNEIIEIREDRQNGTKIETSSSLYSVSETIEQIEAQLLRDKFAMAALPSFINTRVTVEQATRQAYVYADAMLKERLK